MAVFDAVWLAPKAKSPTLADPVAELVTASDRSVHVVPSAEYDPRYVLRPNGDSSSGTWYEREVSETSKPTVIRTKKPGSPGLDKTPDGRPVRIARQQFVRVGAARGDFVAHEEGEQRVGFVGVSDVDLQEAALFRVHRGFKELLRVHFTETFVALDAEALAAGGEHRFEKL